MPISPSPAAAPGPAPRARSTRRSSSPKRSWREIACTPSTKATRAAIAPNTPRATDSGLIASSTSDTTRGGHVELVGHARRDQPDDLLLHRRPHHGCRGRAAARSRMEAAAPGYLAIGLPEERRGHEREAVGLVDVVLDHLVVQGDDSHQPGVEPGGRGATLGRAESGQLPSASGVYIPRGTSWPTCTPRSRAALEVIMISSARIGSAKRPCDGGQAVLVGRTLRRGCPRRHGRFSVFSRGAPSAPSGTKGGRDNVPDLLHPGQVGDLARRSAVRGRRRWLELYTAMVEVRRVGSRQEGRVRGLGAPGARRWPPWPARRSAR